MTEDEKFSLRRLVARIRTDELFTGNALRDPISAHVDTLDRFLCSAGAPSLPVNDEV